MLECRSRGKALVNPRARFVMELAFAQMTQELLITDHESDAIAKVATAGGDETGR